MDKEKIEQIVDSGFRNSYLDISCLGGKGNFRQLMSAKKIIVRKMTEEYMKNEKTGKKDEKPEVVWSCRFRHDDYLPVTVKLDQNNTGYELLEDDAGRCFLRLYYRIIYKGHDISWNEDLCDGDWLVLDSEGNYFIIKKKDKEKITDEVMEHENGFDWESLRETKEEVEGKVLITDIQPKKRKEEKKYSGMTTGHDITAVRGVATDETLDFFCFFFDTVTIITSPWRNEIRMRNVIHEKRKDVVVDNKHYMLIDGLSNPRLRYPEIVDAATLTERYGVSAEEIAKKNVIKINH